MEAAELYSYTTISDMSNYILPDTIGITCAMYNMYVSVGPHDDE